MSERVIAPRSLILKEDVFYNFNLVPLLVLSLTCAFGAIGRSLAIAYERKCELVNEKIIFIVIGECPNPDWLGYSGSCYYFSMVHQDFNDALNSCLGMGSLLASVGSQEENDFLQNKYLNINLCTNTLPSSATTSQDYWIGMYRLQCFLNQNNYNYWLDGTEIKYQNWNLILDEPNEDTCCTRLSFPDWKWKDKYCNSTYTFICERTSSVDRELPAYGFEC
ncbi:hypothetical protein HELRODRAFT_183511 [Helobdella robusta]|uniref:C-type lectin domain-containing protein n=1 Tax=Helobdella robusta TaxID=6412 RepID=T1FJR8_HELRO|nr:hypothetical protein HELRODRAFT_183511 [Helobdella robusta]ESO11124.1 hypothetical protein HELRODRAFT_183511 [Helobdella robusta]